MVPCFGPELLSLAKSLFYPVNGQYILGAVLQSIDESTKPNRPTTNEHNSALSNFRGFQACECITCCKVTSREDISHKAKLQLIDALRGLQDGTVRQGYSHILSLGTVEQWAAKQHALCASRRVSIDTVKAFPTGDREWRYDHVALLEIPDSRAKVADSSRKFVAHYKACCRSLVATKDMQLAIK
jgi:hypothetical protein